MKTDSEKLQRLKEENSLKYIYVKALEDIWISDCLFVDENFLAKKIVCKDANALSTTNAREGEFFWAINGILVAGKNDNEA